MNLAEFEQSIENRVKPQNLSLDLEALWEDAVGNWDAAHEIADKQNQDRIHAYLHRKEGDEFNAGYWYRRCGLSVSNMTLSEEWQQLVEELLN